MTEENFDDVISERHVNEVKDSRIVVAALIATVTFPAGITVPACYINEKGLESRPGVPPF